MTCSVQRFQTNLRWLVTPLDGLTWNYPYVYTGTLAEVVFLDAHKQERIEINTQGGGQGERW